MHIFGCRPAILFRRSTAFIAMSAAILAIPHNSASAAEAAFATNALPSADPHYIVTLQTENDVIGRTDRDYTAGIRLGFTTPNVDAAGNPYLPQFLRDAGTFVWGDGRQRLSLDISESIFTPKNTDLAVPNRKDRPYAGVMAGSAFLLHDSAHARNLLGISAGVLGPSARAEDIQNGFHDLIGDKQALGWSHQIKDMPVVQILAGRTWRYGLGGAGAIEFDVLPSITGAVGTLRDYAQAGLQFRLGQGLQSDFGTTRIRPGLSGSDAYTPTRDLVWYVFAGADGQAVGFDATLDGNPFKSGPHVSSLPFVGEMQAGVAVIFRGVRFTYTHVVQTQEFRGQRGGLFQFGSIAASVRF
jgi:lipid A 3-O-deacylase